MITLDIHLNSTGNPVLARPGLSAPGSVPTLFTGDFTTLFVRFWSGSPGSATLTNTVLLEGFSLKFGSKVKKSDSDCVIFASVFTPVTTGDGLTGYSAELDLNTDKLTAALASLDEVEVFSDIELRQGTDRQTFQFKHLIKKDVVTDSSIPPSHLYTNPGATTFEGVVTFNYGAVLNGDINFTGANVIGLPSFDPNGANIGIGTNSTTNLSLGNWACTSSLSGSTVQMLTGQGCGFRVVDKVATIGTLGGSAFDSLTINGNQISINGPLSLGGGDITLAGTPGQAWWSSTIYGPSQMWGMKFSHDANGAASISIGDFGMSEFTDVRIYGNLVMNQGVIKNEYSFAIQCADGFGIKFDHQTEQIVIGDILGSTGNAPTVIFNSAVDFSGATVTGLPSFDAQASNLYIGNQGNTYSMILGSPVTDVWCYGNLNVADSATVSQLRAQWNYIGNYSGNTVFNGTVDFTSANVIGLSGGGGGGEVNQSASYTWTGPHSFNYTTGFNNSVNLNLPQGAQFEVFNSYAGNGMRFDSNGFYVGMGLWGGSSVPNVALFAETVAIGHSNTQMGFFGVQPVNRPTASPTAESIWNALIALGLISN